MFKEVVLGALGWGPKRTTKSLGQQGAKEAPALIQGEAESASVSGKDNVSQS